MLSLSFYYPIPENVLTPDRNTCRSFKCQAKSHFGMVFTLQQDFEEEAVVRSEKQVILDQDALTYERMENLRASLSGVDQTLFQHLFPGMLASSIPQHSTPTGPAPMLATPNGFPSPFPATRGAVPARAGATASCQPTEKRKASVNTNDDVITKKSKVVRVENGEIEDDELEVGELISSESEESTDTTMDPDEQPSEDYADSYEPSSSSASSEGHSS